MGTDKNIIIKYIEKRFNVIFWGHEYALDDELNFYLNEKERAKFLISKGDEIWGSYSFRIETFIQNYFNEKWSVVVYPEKEF